MSSACTTATTMSSNASSMSIKAESEHSSPFQRAHVPLELIRFIIAQINDRGSLYALTLSSSLLRSEVEPLLYESPMSHYPRPTLSPPLPHTQTLRESIDNRDTHLVFLRTITNTPRLALLVRSYQSIEVLQSSDEELCRYTSVALRMMHGLKELRVRSFGMPSVPAEWLLLGLDKRLESHQDFTKYVSKIDAEEGSTTEDKIACEGDLEACTDGAVRGRPSFQLHTFFWGPLPPDYFGVAAFLRTQQALRAVAIPHLSYLSMYRTGLSSAGLARLKALQIPGSFPSGTINSLGAPLAGLEVLELVECDEEDLTELHTFPSLRELILSIPHFILPHIKPQTLFFFDIGDPLFVVDVGNNATTTGSDGAQSKYTSNSDTNTDSDTEANSESEARTDSNTDAETNSDYETESDSESGADSDPFDYDPFAPRLHGYDHDTTLPHRPTPTPPSAITALFASCPKLEMVDAAMGAELVPPLVMERFLGDAGKGREGEVVLYARWRRSMFEREGESREFELLTVDEVRRGRTMAYW